MRRGVGLLILGLAAAAGGAVGQEKAGRVGLAAAETAVELNRHVLEDLGVEVVFRQTVGEEGGFVRALFPAVAPSLEVRAPGASFGGLAGGNLRHEGGFDLAWPGGRQSFEGFVLGPAGEAVPGEALFELRAADGAVPLWLSQSHPQVLADRGEILLLNMDLRLSESFARRLGRPEAAGASVGSADVRATLAQPLTRGNVPCEDNLADELDVDIELTLIGGLTEVHHDAERVAMAPYVELYNIGPSDVAWYRPIPPDGVFPYNEVGPHPFLAISFYRLADGAMRQIGRADVKHAFFAANSLCECAGSQILYAGCYDLYQATTNYNRVNLGPRHEVTASTGAWQSLGSHFDGSPVDDERSHHGEGASHPDPFEHRLVVAAEDLNVPGARYFVEAWYVTPGDVDIFNSMGRREVAPQLGAFWTFPPVDGGVTQGATLDAWIDPAAPPPGAAADVLDTGEGHLELATATAALPSGATRYDYGLMNFDFDRRIRSFSVPLPAGVELASIGFHDGDLDPGNDWQATVTAGDITWSTPAGDPQLNALDWGTLYSFRFDANAAPAAPDPVAGMDVLEAGSPSQLTLASKGPGSSFVAVHRLEVVGAGSGLGTVTSTPAGIGCGEDCDELYAPATAVELAALAAPGSKFFRWTEGGATLGTAGTQGTVLDTDRSLTAVFELCDRRLAAQTVDDERTFEACQIVRAGAGFVVGASGFATLRGGAAVMLDEGFSMTTSGGIAFEVDPSLLP